MILYEVSFKQKNVAWYIRNRLVNLYGHSNPENRTRMRIKDSTIYLEDLDLSPLERLALKIGARFSVRQISE